MSTDAGRWLWSLDGLKKLKKREVREWKNRVPLHTRKQLIDY